MICAAMSALRKMSARLVPSGMQVRFGTTMKVLLIENVINRGQKGEIVRVRLQQLEKSKTNMSFLLTGQEGVLSEYAFSQKNGR